MQQQTEKTALYKRLAAQAALDLIEPGMHVGLGSGSTAKIFIELLGKKYQQEKFPIAALATSFQSEKLARSFDIPLLSETTTESLDIVVDGADQIDSEKRMIKGLGGALLREKIVANMGDQVVIIADESKKVDYLGKSILPVEITIFGCAATIKAIEAAGYSGVIRKKKENSEYFLTDQNNYIFDISLSHFCLDPEKIDHTLKAIAGVVETGFFLKEASIIFLGLFDQTVKKLT